MNRRNLWLALGVVAMVGGASVGCGVPFIEASNDQGYSDAALERNSNDPYVRTWQAMRMVLEREYGANNVQSVDYPERQWRKLIVHSRLTADGGALQRIEVRAWVSQNRYNEIEPVIVVMQQMYASDNPGHAVSPIVFGSMGARKLWIDLGTNDKLAAELLNKTYAALNGPSNFSGRYVPPAHKPYVDFVPAPQAQAPADDEAGE